MTAPLRLVDDPARVRLALSPIRRRMLEELVEPASATELAARIGITRQKANYHLRVLEQAGLVEMVELRQRRGCVERVLRASAGLVLDPAMLGRRNRVREHDRHAAEHLIATAEDTVREVARMTAAAGARHERLLTFTVESRLTFARPADVHRFTDELAAALQEIARRYDSPSGAAYRVVIGGHPAPAGGTRSFAPDTKADIPSQLDRTENE